MKHSEKELLKMFVDGTSLESAQFTFLANCGMIHEVEPGAWALTTLGMSTLIDRTVYGQHFSNQ